MGDRVMAAGDLAYIDVLAGLVPCKVTGFAWCRDGGFGLVEVDSCRVDEAPIDRPRLFVDVTVTAERPGYRRGERLRLSVIRVVPRGSVFTIRGMSYFHQDWRVDTGDGWPCEIFA